MTTQLRLICQFQNVLDNPRNSIEVPGPVCVLTLDSESPRCRIETESPPTKSGKICPVASMRKRQREDHQNGSDAGIGTDQACGFSQPSGNCLEFGKLFNRLSTLI